jgi:hypothetical protein
MGKTRATRDARRPSDGSAQAPVSPQRHGWPVPQPQPQPDGLAGAAWQPQVQVAPAQSEQRQAKVSVVFMVVFSLGLEKIRRPAP